MFISGGRSPGGSPHTLPKVGCIPANQTGTCCATRWFRYGWREPSVVRLSVASAKVAHFFPRDTVTMQGTHAKICRVPTLYGFSMFFHTETPEALPGRDTTCVRSPISFVSGVRSPGGSPHALPKVGCIPANQTGTCYATRWFRYGWRGPSAVRLSVASAKVAHFFPRATVTMQGTHAKICRVPTMYGFSMIFRTENP